MWDALEEAVQWCRRSVMVGANFNNGSNDGPFYFNCNNSWGNANYNIGLRPFHRTKKAGNSKIRPSAFPGLSVRNHSITVGLVG